MALTRATRERLRLTLISALVGSGTGIGYVAARGLLQGDGAWQAFAQGSLNGLLIAGGLFGFVLLVEPSSVGGWLRRQSFLVGLAIRALVSGLIIVAGLFAGRAVIAKLFGQSVTPYDAATLLRDVGYSFAVFFCFQFALQVAQLVGARVLVNFLVGRYHCAVHEERIFLFADLVDSTAIARRLGDDGAHAMISRVFFDLDDVIADHGGEVHRYIGDEVVVTWPLAVGLRDARCLRCWLAIQQRLTTRGPWYDKAFGVRPQLRGGMHGGPVAAGECGDRKREIVYFGDTVNAAARIAGACRQLGQPFLISGELLERCELPAGVTVVPVGRTALRGRGEETELFSLSPLAGSPSGDVLASPA